MLLVRLAYVADLPAPAELVRQLTGVPTNHGAAGALPAAALNTPSPLSGERVVVRRQSPEAASSPPASHTFGAGPSLSRGAGEAARRDSEMRNEVAGHPLVRAVLDTFPGATIAAVRDRSAPVDPAAQEDGVEDDTIGEDAIGEDGASAGEEGS